MLVHCRYDSLWFSITASSAPLMVAVLIYAPIDFGRNSSAIPAHWLSAPVRVSHGVILPESPLGMTARWIILGPGDDEPVRRTGTISKVITRVPFWSLTTSGRVLRGRVWGGSANRYVVPPRTILVSGFGNSKTEIAIALTRRLSRARVLLDLDIVTPTSARETLPPTRGGGEACRAPGDVARTLAGRGRRDILRRAAQGERQVVDRGELWCGRCAFPLLRRLKGLHAYCTKVGSRDRTRPVRLSDPACHEAPPGCRSLISYRTHTSDVRHCRMSCGNRYAQAAEDWAFCRPRLAR